MSSFDTEVSVLHTQISTPSAEALEAGAEALIELGIITGIMLPIANPQTGQPIVAPTGKYRFSFGREQAIEIFTQALEAAQNLPEAPARPSGKLEVASDMNAVKRAADEINRLTKR